MEAVRTAPTVTALPDLEFTLPPWQADARCQSADPEAFFIEKGGRTDEGKAICAACPVIDDCLTFALDHEADDPEVFAHGIWGGLSPKERKRLLRQRVAA